MDIVSAYANYQASTTMAQVQVAVAKKVMDAQRLEGAAALKLLQSAATGVSQSGDALVAAATGLGTAIDIYG